MPSGLPSTLPPQQCHLLVRRQESTLRYLGNRFTDGLERLSLVAPYAQYILRRVCRVAQVSRAAARERGRCADPLRLGEDLAELAALLSTDTWGAAATARRDFSRSEKRSQNR